MRFSIVIPTWEQYGNGVFFLTQLINSIKSQTLDDYEVIISDHSINYEIQNLCKEFNQSNILHFRNENNRGNSPFNLNFGLSRAKGEIIKVMFQDDFFINPNALELISNSFILNNCKWLVNGCCHTTDTKEFFNYMTPKWNDKILEGVNTISSPSVLSFVNQNINYFDENLTMLMDCEYYYQLYLRYGEPFILKETLISNRIHQNQISSRYDKNIKEEINFVKDKYKYVNM